MANAFSSTSLPGDLKEVSLEISQDVVLAYAEMTSDFNPIHVDPEFASNTPFGHPIAHGTMSLCLILKALEKTFGSRCSASECEVRFVRPVPVGGTVRAGGRLVDKKAGRYEVFVETDSGLRAVEGTIAVHPEESTG